MRSPPAALIEAHAFTARHLDYRPEPPGHDHWMTPMEALAAGRGDCDEFAGVVLWKLDQDGWPRERLRLGLCVVGPRRERHAAALATDDDGVEWVVDPLWLSEPTRKEDAAEHRDWASYDGGAWRHEGAVL